LDKLKAPNGNHFVPILSLSTTQKLLIFHFNLFFFDFFNVVSLSTLYVLFICKIAIKLRYCAILWMGSISKDSVPELKYLRI
jgi:hypothetical protein